MPVRVENRGAANPVAARRRACGSLMVRPSN